jgi:hypothetical protein
VLTVKKKSRYEAVWKRLKSERSRWVLAIAAVLGIAFWIFEVIAVAYPDAFSEMSRVRISFGLVVAALTIAGLELIADSDPSPGSLAAIFLGTAATALLGPDTANSLSGVWQWIGLAALAAVLSSLGIAWWRRANADD